MQCDVAISSRSPRRILLGQDMPREKIQQKMMESMRGEITSQVKKYSMSDSKLVEVPAFSFSSLLCPVLLHPGIVLLLSSRMIFLLIPSQGFLDALRPNTDADSAEGGQDKELRAEFQRVMLPYLLCSTAGQGPLLILISRAIPNSSFR